MSDRELLEMAAKAAGLRGSYMSIWGEVGISEDDPDGGMWNPLEDDGDALRLAVALRLSQLWQHDWLMVYRGDDSVRERDLSDPYAATRRAIVRAAAEIGRGIKQPTCSDLPEDNYYKSQAEAEEAGRAAAEIGKAMP